MGLFVSLLRGVNVSGHGTVRMAALKSLYEELGYKDVRTYLQSGNVVFSAAGKAHAIAGEIRRAVREAFDLDVPVLVMPSGDLVKVARENPFLARPHVDPAFLHVTFLANAPVGDLPQDRLPVNGDEEVLLHGGNIYLYCPHGYGNTKLTNNYFERLLKIPATTRNWRTVLALCEMAVPGPR